MYAIVPAIEGVPQIGNNHLIVGVSLSENRAVVHFEGQAEEGWEVITESEFRELANLPEPEPEPVEPIEPPEPAEEKLARLEEQNLILMDALATVFEEVLELRFDLEGAE
ncbi:MAG TPA: hypothetical protein VFD57_06485 [Clostridia bacterium]|nr:hypothetical protein [Clostridia bacterium]